MRQHQKGAKRQRPGKGHKGSAREQARRVEAAEAKRARRAKARLHRKPGVRA